MGKIPCRHLDTGGGLYKPSPAIPSVSWAEPQEAVYLFNRTYWVKLDSLASNKSSDSFRRDITSLVHSSCTAGITVNCHPR